MIKTIFADIKKIKSTKKELREFGLTVGGILVILGILALWRGKAAGPYFIIPGTLLVAFGFFLPQALKPLQKTWMAFAVIMGFFVSNLLLAALFFIIITPIGLLMRVLGKDVLDQRIDKKRTSYWHDRRCEVKEKNSYENQF